MTRRILTTRHPSDYVYFIVYIDGLYLWLSSNGCVELFFLRQRTDFDLMLGRSFRLSVDAVPLTRLRIMIEL